MSTVATLWVKLGLDSKGYKDGLNKATASTSKFSKVSKVAAAAGVALLAAGLAKATKAAFDFTKQSVLLAARADTLAVVVEKMGENVGYSAKEMRGFEESIQSMGITTIGSREAIAQLIRAEIDLAKASDLARLAQDAAVIAGENSSQAFTALTTIIATGNTLMARRRGLMVDFEGAYKTLGEQLGKTKNEMTDAELSQARLNEVMSKGETIAGVYEAAMTSAGKKLTSYPRYAEELKVAFGKKFQDVFVLAIDAVTNLTKATTIAVEEEIGLITKLMDVIEKVSGGIDAFAKKEIAEGLLAKAARLGVIDESEYKRLQRTFNLIKTGGMVMGLFGADVEEIMELSPEFVAELEAIGDEMAHIEKHGETPRTIRNLHKTRAAAEGAAEEVGKLGDEIGELSVEQETRLNFVLGLKDLQDDFDEVRESFAELGEEQLLLQEQLAGGVQILSDADQAAVDEAYQRIYEINQEIENLDSDEPLSTLVGLQDEATELRELIDEATGGFITMGKAEFDKLTAELGEVEAALAKTEEAWRRQTQEMILAKLAAKAATDEDLEFILQLEQAWGLVGPASMSAALMIEDATNSMEGPIDERMRQIMLLEETLVNMGKGMDAVMAARAAEWTVTIRTVGSLPAGDIVLPTITPLAPTPGLPQIPGFDNPYAAGGHISANELAIIGEQGPELFMPSGSGTIIPNHQLQSGGEGSSNEDLLDAIELLPERIAEAVVMQ